MGKLMKERKVGVTGFTVWKKEFTCNKLQVPILTKYQTSGFNQPMGVSCCKSLILGFPWWTDLITEVW